MYHIRPHAGLDKLDSNEHQTPIARWRQDLNHVRPLTTAIAERLDDIFCHYVIRTVRKDGTVSWNGIFFEVYHHLIGEKITLVVNPHTQMILRVENAFGDNFGQVNPIDRIKNTNRKRQRPYHKENTLKTRESMVEVIHQEYIDRYALLINKKVEN